MLHVAISFPVATEKPLNLFSLPSAIFLSPFSHGFVNSLQASQFAQRNYRIQNKHNPYPD